MELVALGAPSDPVASAGLLPVAEIQVPRRRAPSVETEDARDITSPLHSRACWNEAAESAGFFSFGKQFH
jgi:hypothetical protein